MFESARAAWLDLALRHDEARRLERRLSRNLRACTENLGGVHGDEARYRGRPCVRGPVIIGDLFSDEERGNIPTRGHGWPGVGFTLFAYAHIFVPAPAHHWFIAEASVFDHDDEGTQFESSLEGIRWDRIVDDIEFYGLATSPDGFALATFSLREILGARGAFGLRAQRDPRFEFLQLGYIASIMLDRPELIGPWDEEEL